MLSKFAYPSIEYVLATAHYPEEFRKEARHYPTFFPAPPVQVFHVAYGHIPLFVPLPRQQHGGHKPPKPRIVRYRIKSAAHEKKLILERIAEQSTRQRSGRYQARCSDAQSSSSSTLTAPTSSDSSELSESDYGNETHLETSSEDNPISNIGPPQAKVDNNNKEMQVFGTT